MGYFSWFFVREPTARERRQRAIERQQQLRARRTLYDEWYNWYRSLGLGDQRASQHARRKADAQKRFTKHHH